MHFPSFHLFFNNALQPPPSFLCLLGDDNGDKLITDNHDRDVLEWPKCPWDLCYGANDWFSVHGVIPRAFASCKPLFRLRTVTLLLLIMVALQYNKEFINSLFTRLI